MRRAALLVLVLTGACQDETQNLLKDALRKLSSPPAPGPDHSNKYVGNVAAESLGHRFYFDSDFSGAETYHDMLLRPMTTPGRAPTGQAIGVACNSCHDVQRAAGSDPTAEPLGHRVSIGAGAYDVNGMQSVNSAYAGPVYWNGRNDSLWAQIIAVTESSVSVGGSRARSAWRIADAYRADYEAVFGAEHPLPPELDSVASQKARLEDDGTCKLDGGSCPAFCHTIMPTAGPHTGESLCVPRFPLEGRPGFLTMGQPPVCAFGAPSDEIHPNAGNYDCMDLADQLAVTQIYVNYAKAIAAYEYTLVATKAPYDDWVASDFTKGINASAQRGARLFIGKAACATCHSGPLLSDFQFHNIGVPQEGQYVPTTADCPSGSWCDCVSDDKSSPTNCLPWGARDGLRKLQSNKFRRDSRWSDDLECANHNTVHIDANYAAAHPDECDGRIGLYSATLDDGLKGAWRTPSLRNVASTGPYMHTGGLASLEAVIEHYDSGGMAATGETVGQRDQKLLPLHLSDAEKKDLVSFLQSLSAPLDTALTATPDVPAPSGF
jgi:cytochrome c peroxidase